MVVPKRVGTRRRAATAGVSLYPQSAVRQEKDVDPPAHVHVQAKADSEFSFKSLPILSKNHRYTCNGHRVERRTHIYSSRQNGYKDFKIASLSHQISAVEPEEQDKRSFRHRTSVEILSGKNPDSTPEPSLDLLSA